MGPAWGPQNRRSCGAKPGTGGAGGSWMDLGGPRREWGIGNPSWNLGNPNGSSGAASQQDTAPICGAGQGGDSRIPSPGMGSLTRFVPVPGAARSGWDNPATSLGTAAARDSDRHCPKITPCGDRGDSTARAPPRAPAEHSQTPKPFGVNPNARLADPQLFPQRGQRGTCQELYTQLGTGFSHCDSPAPL